MRYFKVVVLMESVLKNEPNTKVSLSIAQEDYPGRKMIEEEIDKDVVLCSVDILDIEI